MSLIGRMKNLVAFSNIGITKRIHFSTSTEPGVMENKLLAGKNVLVTGAGKNIGRAIAVEMAKQGANVFFTDIDRESSLNLEKQLGNYSVITRAFLSDISRYEDIDNLCDELINDGINIDILINNVGIQFKGNTIFELDIGEWEKTYDVNILGPIYLTKSIVNRMRSSQTEGSVLFITSIHQWSVRTVASYSSSKAALGMIVDELALDLAPYGIRVNGIAPGWIAEDNQGRPLKHKYCPLYESSISPHYIGRAAVYMSSDYFSRHTTGTVLKIDGGLSLWNHCCEQKQQKSKI